MEYLFGFKCNHYAHTCLHVMEQLIVSVNYKANNRVCQLGLLYMLSWPRPLYLPVHVFKIQQYEYLHVYIHIILYRNKYWWI